MSIYSIYILSRSGGLIYNYDHNPAKHEYEKTFGFPLEFKLDVIDKRCSVVFGQKDGVEVGHVLLEVNKNSVNGHTLADGRSVADFLADSSNYPVTLKFGRPKLTTNEKIILASMFYPLFAIASQLSPEPRSSGIEVLEADTFKLHCYQTLTGVKFMVTAEHRHVGIDMLLKKIYELYADYALKNPFYSLDMPIRCELFDLHLQAYLEQMERLGTVSL